MLLQWQPQSPPDTGKSMGITVLRCALFLAVLASILFAHGCHGDEDHELFNACIGWIGKGP